MASFDEYRKKLNSKYGAKTVKSSEEEVPSTSTSPVTVTSDFTGTPFDEYRQKMNTKYRTDKTDEEGISKWFSDAAKAMQSMHIYNSNNGGRYVPDYGGSDAVRIDELLNSSSDVYNYLLNHKDELDNFDELDKQFSSYRKALMQYDMTNYYTKNYYGQFEDEDSYNAYLKEYERQQTYSGKGYDELKGILGSMDAGEEKDWLTNYTYSVMTIDDYNKAIAEKEAELKAAKSADASRNVQGNSYAMYPTLTAKSSDTKAIEAELERLKNGKWKLENEQKYSGLESNEDYAKYSTQVSEDPTSKLRIGNWDIIGDLAYDYINDIDGTREKQDYSGEGNARGNIDLYKYSFMTDTEIAHYNYLYNVEGKKAANEYLDYLSYDLDERRTQQLASDNAAFATEHPVLSSLYSIPTNLMSGIGMLDVAAQNVVSGVKEAVTGEYTPINYNSWGMSPTVQSTSIRGTVAENLANEYGVIELNREDHPILSRLLNGKSLGDVYQLGMSMADSGTVALLSPIIGGFGTVLLGGAAGSQGVLDAVSRGATDEQALWMGVLNGTFEALFEKVSLDNLLKGNARNIVTAFFKQGFIEGTEELSTSFFNNIADILIMAEKSGYRSNIAAYMAAGLTEEDAAKEALKDAAIEMGWDFIGGVISGGIMGGGQVINTVQQNIDAKRIYGTDIATLINEALGIDPNNALAIKLQSRLDSGKNVSGSQIRNIVEQNESAMLSQDISTIESAAANRLTELGETGNVNAIASALAKQAAGQRITRSERQLISNSTYGQRVANELTPENINSGEYSTAWAENLDTNRINPTEYSRLVEATQITQESSIPTENKVFRKWLRKSQTTQQHSLLKKLPKSTVLKLVLCSILILRDKM